MTYSSFHHQSDHHRTAAARILHNELANIDHSNRVDVRNNSFINPYQAHPYQLLINQLLRQHKTLCCIYRLFFATIVCSFQTISVNLSNKSVPWLMAIQRYASSIRMAESHILFSATSNSQSVLLYSCCSCFPSGNLCLSTRTGYAKHHYTRSSIVILCTNLRSYKSNHIAK